MTNAMSGISNAWLFAAIGGAMIGIASGGLMLGLGRIAGISGVFGGLVKPVNGDWGWRLAFVAGMLVAGAAATLTGVWTPPASTQPLLQLIGAGLMVGIGTTLANGCTSGHGICGLALMSTRSLVAVACFLGTGIAMTFVLRHSAAVFHFFGGA